MNLKFVEQEIVLRLLQRNPEVVKPGFVEELYYDGVYHLYRYCSHRGLKKKEVSIDFQEIFKSEVCDCMMIDRFGEIAFLYFAFTNLHQLQTKTKTLDAESLALLSDGPFEKEAWLSLDGRKMVEEVEDFFGFSPFESVEAYLEAREGFYNDLMKDPSIQPVVEEYAHMLSSFKLRTSLEEKKFSPGLISQASKTLDEAYQERETVFIFPSSLDISVAQGRDPVADYFIEEKFFKGEKAAFLEVTSAVAQRLEELNWADFQPDIVKDLTVEQLEVLNGLYNCPTDNLTGMEAYTEVEDAVNAAKALA